MIHSYNMFERQNDTVLYDEFDMSHNLIKKICKFLTSLFHYLRWFSDMNIYVLSIISSNPTILFIEFSNSIISQHR